MTVERPVPQTRGEDRIARSMSQRVALSRVICIFFMTFVHVQPGIAENVYDRPAGLFDTVYFMLTRLIGLSSVSLLSVVSGYFVVSTLARTGATGLAGAKLRTLVVPLVSWNAVMLALLLAYGLLSGHWRDMPEATMAGMANAFLAMTEWPLVVPLWFLRDLFVCCLLSPLLTAGLRHAPLTMFALLVLYALFGNDLYLLQRPQLLLFFALGMWLRIAEFDEQAIDRATRPLLAGFVVMTAAFLAIRIDRILLSEMNEALLTGLDTLLRISMAAAVWQLTRFVRRSRAAPALLWLEPYAFFLFCSHAVLFHFGGILLRPVFGNYGSDLFSISFFLQPLLAVAAAIIGLQIVSRLQLLPFLLNAGRRVALIGTGSTGRRAAKAS